MFLVYKYCAEHVNPNIYWRQFLKDDIVVIEQFDKFTTDENINKRIMKIFNKIKNTAWEDKPPGEENQNNPRNKILEKAVEIFMNNDYKNKTIGILLCGKDSENLPSYYYDKYKKYSKTIKTVGEYFGYDVKIFDNVDDLNNCDVIFPLSLFLLSKEDINKLQLEKIVYPTFHDYNIIMKNYNYNKETFFNFIHTIDNFINYNDINIYQYNYLEVEQRDRNALEHENAEHNQRYDML